MAETETASAVPAVGSARARARIALIGNPNTGKTTLFNRLCGARAKTSNFPGTTTGMRLGQCQISAELRVDLLDLPGLYQLNFDGLEARLVRDLLSGRPGEPHIDAVLVVVDAANLARNLVLVGELLGGGMRVVVALNMTDLATRRGRTIDSNALARRLGVPVAPIVAAKGQGLDGLRAALAAGLSEDTPASRPPDRPAAGATVEELTSWADAICSDMAHGQPPTGETSDGLTERLDRLLLHPVLGLLAFLGVMGSLFWTLFALATVPMNLIEWTFTQLGAVVEAYLSDGPVRSLLTDGVIGGIAGTVVFLPQIMLLFFLISLLEDTGYLARAAFVNDRFLRRFGLPGHAFVPLLTSHACALPGIMSARLIPDRRDRLATILVLPFMSCSARLPVYVLLTSLLFADRPALAGLAFGACYLLGAAAALLSALLIGRTALRGLPRPMMLELPTYKRPSFSNALLTAWDQGMGFLKTAGTIIFAICVVMWWLSAYPRVAPPTEALALRAQAGQTTVNPLEAQALAAEADALEARARQAGSFAGRLGRIVQPVFAPLGYDWQLTVGVLTSFIAREVFVSTMSVLAGAGDQSGGDVGILTRIRGMTRDDGTLVFTRATSASALVFFVLAMQCLATLTVTRREAGGLKYAAWQLGYMSALAYVSAFVVFQTLRAFGIE